MPTLVEPLFDSRQMSTDGRVKTSEIDFLVYGEPGEVLFPEDALYAEGVPKLVFEGTNVWASTYPYDDTMRLDSKNVKQRINENTYIINCKYSNNNQFTFSQQETNTSISFQTGVEEISMPFATKDNVVYPPVAQGSIPAPDLRWQIRELKMKATYIDLKVTCQFDDIQANTHVDYIANQIGNWHKLGRRDASGADARDYWRFLGGNATSIEMVPAPNGVITSDGRVYRYNLEYSWRQRKTIPKLDKRQWNGFPANELMIFGQDINQFMTVAVRAPNTPQGDPTLYAITSKPEPRNTAAEEGWRDLPGRPLGR